jgi:hypothetical protein
VNGGYATSTPTGAPLLAPPNAALPGSGPATGLPPAVGVNDSRYGGGGSVYQPSAGTLTGTAVGNEATTATAPGVTVSLPTGAGSNNASGAAAPRNFNPGMGEFSEASANASEVSLGDIVRKYKAQRAAAHPRQFDNNSLRHASYGTTDTNSASLPQSDQASAATYGSSGAASVPEGVINPADYAAVQAAVARSQAATNTSGTQNAGNNSLPDPNRSASISEPQSQEVAQQQSATQVPQNDATQNTQDATVPQVENRGAANTSAKQLPASASQLPLLGILGLFALVAGGLFTNRLRRNEA